MNRPRLLIAALGTIAAILLTGCGSSSDSASTTTTSPAATTTTLGTLPATIQAIDGCSTLKHDLTNTLGLTLEGQQTGLKNLSVVASPLLNATADDVASAANTMPPPGKAAFLAFVDAARAYSGAIENPTFNKITRRATRTAFDSSFIKVAELCAPLLAPAQV